ncbi:hypothetical protein [Sinorhizobium sp. BG8]|uniref:hypothetical protein n=1 Tax=Sinorhizobium sp. BG8 TaxID=2613773 RepID=UPI001FED4448|nr:hypothetical protein [Sinorhizobium sp. BG8]
MGRDRLDERAQMLAKKRFHLLLGIADRRRRPEFLRQQKRSRSTGAGIAHETQPVERARQAAAKHQGGHGRTDHQRRKIVERPHGHDGATIRAGELLAV